MLKTSIQTGGLITAKNFLDFDEKFKLLQYAGFEALDYNLNIHYSSNDIKCGKHSSFFDMKTTDMYMILESLKASALNHNLFFGQTHAPFPVHIIGNPGSINDYIFEVIKKSIEITGFLDCPYIVIHPITTSYTFTKKAEKKQNIEFYTKLIPDAQKHGVTICLENMFFTTKSQLCEASCSDADEALEYIEELNRIAGTECFAFCFDLGHATVLGKNIRHYLNVLGKHVRAVHIHDNDGRQDLHMMPYSCSTNWGIDTYTDWNGFISGLADINYKGTINFEVHQAFHIFPEAVHKEMLTLLNAIGKDMAAQIKGLR